VVSRGWALRRFKELLSVRGPPAFARVHVGRGRPRLPPWWLRGWKKSAVDFRCSRGPQVSTSTALACCAPSGQGELCSRTEAD